MKVTSSYPSVIGGVSELPPASRGPGQCSEQINFISDRTVGLARRPGSVFLGERALGAQPAASHQDGLNWRVIPWQQAGGDYSALVRTGARTPGCELPGLQVFSHESESFLPVVRGPDPALDVLWDTGCSAGTSVGAYLFLAGQGTVPSATSTDKVLDPAFVSKSAVWVRGGAFDREYKLKLRVGTAWYEVAYSTPQAAYPGVLDTSRIAWSIPDPAGGTEAVTLPLTVVPAASSARITLSAWAPPYAATISNLVLRNKYGVALTSVGSGLVTSPLQYGGNIPSSPSLYLHSSMSGEEITVEYTYQDWFNPPQAVRYRQVAVALSFGRGVAYVATALISPISISGLTAQNSPDGLPPTGYYYNEAADPHYIYFHESKIGAALIVTATRAKMVPNPDYQRLVDDAKLAYDRGATAYAIDAAAKLTPGAIAQEFAQRLTAQGIVATAVGNHIALSNVDEVQASDGGDGSLLRAVDTEVAAIADLTDKHFIGKVVRVRPVGGTEGYYVKATAKVAGTTGFGEALWVEAAGIEHSIQHAFCYATLSGGTCYVASSATLLAAILPGAHPDFPVSSAGDSITAPLPAFIGKRITLLTTFQNRLIVGSGGTLNISATGDFLRFFPKSVLTVPADDAFEVTAQGSDTDILRQAVLYGRDLLLFGDNRQYAISGKEALSPTGISLSVVSTTPGAAGVQPQAIGGYLFFANTGERGTAVAQLQPSLDPNNPQVLPVSEGLTGYLSGAPVETARRGNPDTFYMRTSGAPGAVFHYRFTDSQRGRTHSAWSKYTFHPSLGTILGMRARAQGLTVFFLRDAHGDTFLVADLCGEQAQVSTRPYLDSQRPLAHVLTGTGSVRLTSPDSWVGAYKAPSTRFLIGDTMSKLPGMRMLYGDTDLVVGAEQPASWVMTSPYALDKEGRANRSVRLTVQSMRLYAASSSGLEATVVSHSGENTRRFLARRAGDTTLVGRIPVLDFEQQVAVGKNNEDYTLRVSPTKWYPLTVTGVEWTGQLFSRAQRL